MNTNYTNGTVISNTSIIGTHLYIGISLIRMLLLLSILFFFGCSNNEESIKEESKTDKQLENTIDSNNLALSTGGKMFIIPSPIQTAMLIQKSGALYDKEMLHSSSKGNSYSTRFQKCLNLGIYGADLSYITLYDQKQDAMLYFKLTYAIANDIGLASAFDKNLIERFEKNLGAKDSMLVLFSAAYRASNDFLKNDAHNEESALIIAGGWIETLHFALNVQKSKRNMDVKRRIAEQKGTLNNLISLLSIYQRNEEGVELLQNLNGLKSVFDLVRYKYVFKKPITDVVNKHTTITSESEITITPATIQAIRDKVASIRKLITA